MLASDEILDQGRIVWQNSLQFLQRKVGGSFEGSGQTGTLRASLPIHGMTIPTGRTVTTEVHWTFPSPLEARYRLRLEPVFDANGARKAVSFSFDVPA